MHTTLYKYDTISIESTFLVQTTHLKAPSAVFMLCLWSFVSLSRSVFPTDSDSDCSADSQGGPSGLPQAMARAHPHSAGVYKGSGRPKAAQSAANLLSCHQNPRVQTSGTGPAAFPGCKSILNTFST